MIGKIEGSLYSIVPSIIWYLTKSTPSQIWKPIRSSAEIIVTLICSILTLYDNKAKIVAVNTMILKMRYGVFSYNPIATSPCGDTAVHILQKNRLPTRIVDIARYRFCTLLSIIWRVCWFICAKIGNVNK